MLISRAAFSLESDPWTKLRTASLDHSRPKSPRIVPGAASVGFVVPTSVRHPLVTFSPSTTIATTRFSVI